jgi:tRNA threonylcarbamoyladenosine modification (KEOPS) complex  Pcc1 subunit
MSIPMDNNFIAKCEFELPESTGANLEKALAPELANEGERVTVDINLRERGFELEVRSSDIKGLRAALNSYLRWIECSLKVTQLPG